jgi:hypothetical protein
MGRTILDLDRTNVFHTCTRRRYVNRTPIGHFLHMLLDFLGVTVSRLRLRLTFVRYTSYNLASSYIVRNPHPHIVSPFLTFHARTASWHMSTRRSDRFRSRVDGEDVVSRRRNGSSRSEEEEVWYRGGADVDVDFDGGEHLTGLLWHRKLVQLQSQLAICVNGLGSTYAIRFSF